MTEDEMVGWYHQLNGHEFGWAPGVGVGQGGLACCSSWGSQRVGHDWATQLNWNIWSTFNLLTGPGMCIPGRKFLVIIILLTIGIFTETWSFRLPLSILPVKKSLRGKWDQFWFTSTKVKNKVPIFSYTQPLNEATIQKEFKILLCILNSLS